MIPEQYTAIEDAMLLRVRGQRNRLFRSNNGNSDSERVKGIAEIAIGIAMLLGIRRTWLMRRPMTPEEMAWTPTFPKAASFAQLASTIAAEIPRLADVIEEVAAVAKDNANRIVETGKAAMNRELDGLLLDQREAIERAAMDSVSVDLSNDLGQKVIRVKQIRSGFDNAIRSTVLSAYHSGIAEAAMLPEVQEAIPLWTVRAVGDNVTRGKPTGKYPEPNRHYQFSGYMNTMQVLVRRNLLPPIGVNCRCTVVAIPLSVAIRRGLALANGTLNANALAESNRAQELLVASGLVPDKGYRRPFAM